MRSQRSRGEAISFPPICNSHFSIFNLLFRGMRGAASPRSDEIKEDGIRKWE
jgi:hypothetical protein